MIRGGRGAETTLGVRNVKPELCERLVREASAILRTEYPKLTPSLLDHAIWKYQCAHEETAQIACCRETIVKETIIKEVPARAADPFVVDETRVDHLGITPRELEILGLSATGLSNREIATRLFVSENTVQTHSSRLFDKLGAKRRTQTVQIGKTARLIP
jgi:ATP/maltotriose-dependent transcriptional regulator MalT